MPRESFRPLRVAVIGTGYVGLTTGVALAYLGHQVVGVDKDQTKIELLRSGKIPLHEPGLSELLQLVGDRIRFTTEVREAVPKSGVILIAVGTPPKENGEADTRFVEEAAKEVALAFLPEHSYIIAVKSTVPVGSNRRVRHIVYKVLEDRGLRDRIAVEIVSNPEFLREGQALYDTFYPDRIVVGAESPEGVDAMRRLYQPILEQTFDPPGFLPRPDGYTLPPLITTTPTSAELIKYAANAFLALKISFINEIAGLCEKVGADVVEVARGIGLDSRIGPKFLQAGLGWGGSCLPKDTAALLAMGREHGYEMPIVTAAREVNTRQRKRAVEKLQEVLKGVRGRVIGILGLAFKPGTDDVRESPSLDLIRLLLEREAHVRAHDPLPMTMENARKALESLEVEFMADPYAVAKGADALVLATAWPEYRQLDLRKLAKTMRTPVLLDGRNLFDPAEAREAGFMYIGIGR
ncbi:MAG: UDP-glucose dehydrogenase family protein [Candidatus Bipolaricaulaceae bacterium]